MSRHGTPSVWAILPAAGRGARFGGDVPKQYLQIAGQPLIAHALDALLSHPEVAGAMVALAADDRYWPGWTTRHGKPVLRCEGGAERADSVLAALQGLPPGPEDSLVLVHDAARPNLHPSDLERLLHAASEDRDGAILAAPVRDTLKRADAEGRIAATEPRAALWRALTPQAFRRGLLTDALLAARADAVQVTDEAMAVERAGLRPRLVEGREDNLKVTTPADRDLAEFLLSQRQR
ncbi:2-C-methyl-D-erythritol 4-phosphate cytidylyltransferase [Lysobacter sp. H21R4]|uniref:2-C-methyl-D-erythritol 4-phosphate cytidylyltransferase n=1 Tax=Lysobacter sp. H21R4 TaxID=2781021 RepID=UPI001886EE14|nr:2-C-methyl-D-erythritol 4-phosphate cytidylyltransferase [Lysobacter sp. H21R4]QOY63418.1 2-C-methyl-D-erythritol 4-phosphate cytidylyltransferase [Lysobacter sp. H21R4]